MATINRKTEMLCTLNDFAKFAKSKLAGNDVEIAKIDALMTKASGMSGEWFDSLYADRSIDKNSGRAIAVAVAKATA